MPQAVAQLPWGHNVELLDKLDDRDARQWYAHKAVEHGWSRNVLQAQIASDLRDAKAAHSRASTRRYRHRTPSSFATRSRTHTTSSSWVCRGEAKERELEHALLNDIQSFLMEMGRGFALVGRQFPLKIVDEETGEEDEFFIDVLFYNYLLRRFVVIDLKVEDFKPEFTGKMSFYLTTSSIHKDGREGEHGQNHAPPARPWRGVGMVLTLIKTAFITAKTHPRSRSQARLHKDGYLLVRGQGARARSRTFVSTGPALPSGRRPSPRRISDIRFDRPRFAVQAQAITTADLGHSFRPAPLRRVLSVETNVRDPPWLSKPWYRGMESLHPSTTGTPGTCADASQKTRAKTHDAISIRRSILTRRHIAGRGRLAPRRHGHAQWRGGLGRTRWLRTR